MFQTLLRGFWVKNKSTVLVDLRNFLWLPQHPQGFTLLFFTSYWLLILLLFLLLLLIILLVLLLLLILLQILLLLFFLLLIFLLLLLLPFPLLLILLLLLLLLHSYCPPGCVNLRQPHPTTWHTERASSQLSPYLHIGEMLTSINTGLSIISNGLSDC